MDLAEFDEGDRQLIVDYCAPKGIPPSVFLGRWVAPGEPAWTREDRTAVLRWHSEEKRRCRCGQLPENTVGREHEDKWNARRSGTCDACKAIDRMVTVQSGRDDLDPYAGMRYELWRDDEKVTDGG